jgi:hypothetical protein
MNRFAVLSEGFEHLSYPLGRQDASDGQVITERNSQFVLGKANSESEARAAVEASGTISRHASVPVGFVSCPKGNIFVVSLLSGKGASASDFADDSERRSFCQSVVARLGSMHTDGLGCGGLTPDAVEFSGEGAKLKNASALFALTESDSIFYEAVSTLRALAGKGFAKESELEMLASAYLSCSPVCRHGVVQHMESKRIAGMPHKALADAARKYLRYF